MLFLGAQYDAVSPKRRVKVIWSARAMTKTLKYTGKFCTRNTAISWISSRVILVEVSGHPEFLDEEALSYPEIAAAASSYFYV